MKKNFVIAFLVAIVLGFFLVNPWVFAYYLIMLALATTVVTIVVVASLFKRTKKWKSALVWLAVGYTAALTSFCFDFYLRSKILKKRNGVIIGLYDYRTKYQKFPVSAAELSMDLSSFRGKYVPDSDLKNFRLYTKDLYGMPWVFNSKDSTWGR